MSCIGLQRRNKPCAEAMLVFGRYMKWYELILEKSKGSMLIKLLAPPDWYLVSIEYLSLHKY